MRVLVTGAGSFLGRHCVQSLARLGHQVIAASSQTPPNALLTQAQWIVCDLMQAGAPERLAKEARADRVMQLSWVRSGTGFWTDPANRDWVGVSLALARACAEQGAQWFAAAGTCFEYDWPTSSPCIEGVTPTREHTLYDSCKSQLRGELAAFCQSAGIRGAWAHLFYLYGPGEYEGKLVASVARALVRGEPALCSSGRVIRDYMDVRDAGAALAAIIHAGLEGRVNVGSGEGHEVAHIARLLGELAGRSELVRLRALPDRPDDPPMIVADITRLQNEAQLAPTRSLKDGLQDALEWWRTKET